MTPADDTETRFGPAPSGVSELEPLPFGSSQLHVRDDSGAPVRVDRFALLEPIGVGGMGELYSAYDAKLDRKIALKLVRPGRGGDKADSRLLREAQALAKISHPNVVPVFEVGVASDRVFVAMEYVRGRTLSAWLVDARPLPEPQRVRELLAHFGDAARGLAAVHDAGLAHRDFKPDNVLVGIDGRVRIVDFGLARTTTDSVEVEVEKIGEASLATPVDLAKVAVIDDDDLITPDLGIGTLTNTGTLLGTPRYMAPEQWQTQRGDSRSDQFSFCVALYQALYGKWPFEATTMVELSLAVLGGSPREPPRKPEVPARLHAALLRGLAKKADDRWPDMSELIEAIDAALAPPRRRLASSLAAASMLVLLAGLGFSLTRETPRPVNVESPIARLERETAAEQRRVQIAEEIRELDAKLEFDEADQVFEAFAGLTRFAHTRALARAWLDQAARLRERGLLERQLGALGEALLASSSETEARAALIELARADARDHRYEQLGATLLLLDAEADDAELISLRLREAAHRRDLQAALAALDRPGAAPLDRQLGPLLRQLDQVSATDLVAPTIDPRRSSIVELANLDLDGDQHGDLVFVPREGAARVLASRPNLPALQEFEFALDGDRIEFFDPIAMARAPGAPAWVSAASRSGPEIFELELAEGRVEARPIFAITGGKWAAGDLFEGPDWAGWEGYGAQLTERRLIGLHRSRAGTEPFTPTPSLDALDSHVAALTITDLDGDGREELIVGVDGWWAYDVRVLSPSAEPGHFDLAARRKLGGQAGMVSFAAPRGQERRREGEQWLAISVPESAPSPRVFPSESPAGAAPGLYLLAWPGPGQPFELVDHVGLPSNYRPVAGDLDGDAQPELIVQLDSAIVVLRPSALHDAAIWLDGLAYHAIADLDHDGDDELIVSEIESGRIMVLGSGTEHLPVIERHAEPRVEPPSGLADDLREPWIRAETLASVGLYEGASSAFADLARLAGPHEAASALGRAASLLERNGARLRAARLYEQAGDQDSLERALELLASTHEFGAAATIADRLLALPELDEATRTRWRPRAAALHRRAEPESELVFDLGKPLDAGWRIDQPGLLRSESRGLRIDSLGSSAPTLMRHAFVWAGDRLELELELELERLEWGSTLRFELVPVDDEGGASGPALAELQVGSVGGGGHFVLDRTRGTKLEPDSVNPSPRMRSATPPEGETHLHMRVDVTDDSPTSWTSVTTSGEGRASTSLAYQRPIVPASRRPGRYELRISTGVEPWMRGVIRLERLRLVGASDDPDATAATRREQVLLALANADNQRALELLEGDELHELEPRDAAWLRTLALEQLGQWREALPSITRALGGCEDPEALARFGYAMLLLPDRFGPTLREFCPPDRFVVDTWIVAWSALFHHPDLADVHRTMTTQLVDLDRYEPSDFDQARACADLLTARARGWYMQNLGSAADSDIRRAIEVVNAFMNRPTLTLEQSNELRRLGALAHVRLAAVLVTRDQLDDAQLELGAALALDLAPEIIADVIVARSVFAPLRSSPAWARVLAVQAGLE